MPLELPFFTAGEEASSSSSSLGLLAGVARSFPSLSVYNIVERPVSQVPLYYNWPVLNAASAA